MTSLRTCDAGSVAPKVTTGGAAPTRGSRRIRSWPRRWPPGGGVPELHGSSRRLSAQIDRVRGPHTAPTVVIWIDACNEPCRSAYRLLSEFADTDQIRLAVRQLPLADVHPLALPAAEALEAAAAQARFFVLLDDLAAIAVKDHDELLDRAAARVSRTANGSGGGRRGHLPSRRDRANPRGDRERGDRSPRRVHRWRVLRRPDQARRCRTRAAGVTDVGASASGRTLV